ncbi:MAG: ATP-binding protein, partial [Chloroflexota bacterium]|nr:ATP-binding protein [Chloroflexota bacterium]
AAARAASLTRQLLAFSRRQVLQPTVLNLNTVVSDMEKMLRRIIGEDIDLSTMLDLELGRVRADPGQIEQVIMNLAVNARDAMPQGGKIIIKTENVTLDESHVQVIPEARPGRFVCLSVVDTGIGMDKETASYIFEPFFSTKEKGTGLGLAVVYGIVLQHEGWINVYSEPGLGSTFKVYLPAFSVAPKEGEITETPFSEVSEELQGNGERILLVEDDEGISKYARRVLGENGYIVLAAADTKEALHIFEREKGQFDLVFSDVVLPDKSGVQLIELLLSRQPDLPVLLSSGYTDQKSQWTSIRERGIRFIQKPYSLYELLRAIRNAIDASGDDIG